MRTRDRLANAASRSLLAECFSERVMRYTAVTIGRNMAKKSRQTHSILQAGGRSFVVGRCMFAVFTVW